MKIKNLLIIAMSAFCLLSCEDDDNPTPPNTDTIGKVLVETTSYNPDGRSGSSYIQLLPTLSGKADNTNAIQIDFSSPLYAYDQDVFAFPSAGKDATNEIAKYTYDNGKLTKTGSLPTPPYSFAYNLVKINEGKSYVSMYNLGTLWIINPETMEKIGEIDLTSYAHNDNSPEPSMGYVRNDKFYLPLNQLDQNWQPYSDYLQVDVAIIDINTDTVEKVISEKSSKLSFPTRPMLENTIFANENGDIYMTCSGYFGFNPSQTQNGFVCIPSGQQTFDSNKSWDISKTVIDGTNYKPISIFNSQYIKNGKVAAYVAIGELAGSNPYTSKYIMPVLIDLNEKTIQKIEGIPVSSGYGIFIGKENGQIIFGSEGANEVGFFSYNVDNGHVSQLITTNSAPSFLHVFD